MSSPTSEDFHALLREMGELHDKKQRDYGAEGDPFANVRSAAQWGLAPSLGACIRIGDKVARLHSFYKRGELANESVDDAYMDLAVYALIGLLLYREESAREEGETAAVTAAPEKRATFADGAPVSRPSDSAFAWAKRYGDFVPPPAKRTPAVELYDQDREPTELEVTNRAVTIHAAQCKSGCRIPVKYGNWHDLARQQLLAERCGRE